MERWELIWETLQHRRKEGERFALRILILGPADDGSVEREIRCAIKEELLRLEHGAVFPEDLCKQNDAWKDNILADIVMQAKEAELIIIVYRTRGTQSERDIFLNRLLDNHEFAIKTIILVGGRMRKSIMHSLTGQDWEGMSKVAEVYEYDNALEFEAIRAEIIEYIRKRTMELRRLAYVRGLLKGAIC